MESERGEAGWGFCVKAHAVAVDRGVKAPLGAKLLCRRIGQ